MSTSNQQQLEVVKQRARGLGYPDGLVDQWAQRWAEDSRVSAISVGAGVSMLMRVMDSRLRPIGIQPDGSRDEFTVTDADWDLLVLLARRVWLEDSEFSLAQLEHQEVTYGH